MIRILGAFLLGFFCLNLSAQIDREAKIKMIRAIESYAAEKYHMNLQKGFYTEWEHPDTMTCYLYISRKDSIQAPSGVGSYIFFGTRYSAADSARQHWDSLGYATLLYYTSGNSATRLSSRFLSYPPQAIAFICFHELFHRHKSARKSKLPYVFEEATCDWLGNLGSYEFLKWYASSHAEFSGYADSALKQTRVNLKCYGYLVQATEHPELIPQLKDSLSLLFKDYNLFQQDRFLYSLNNALLLRTRNYAANLLLISEYHRAVGSVSETIRLLTRMPGNEADVVKRILRKIR